MTIVLCLDCNSAINLSQQTPQMLKLAKIDSIQKKIDQYSYASTDSIGKGFSSQVYKGKNELTDEEVAIKMIDMKFIKGEVHKTLLASEIEILKLLKNMPNILEVYDVYNTKANTCIITELCEGGDLSKLLKARKTLPETEALSILKQIINGYKGIYRFGIIHRDLKPANIFFVNGKVKIADFGFAVKQSSIKRECNYNVGSPVYMPLEALNQNMYSFKSDVWAIGVIFFEMLTGKTPWRAKTESDLKRQIKNNPIKNLIPSHLSATSAEFLKKTLEVNPLLRMSPEDLERYFSKQDISTPTDDSRSRICEKEEPEMKSLFLTQKRQNQFRTRAISNEKDDRIDRHETQYGKHNFGHSNNMSTTERRKTLMKGFGDTGMYNMNPGMTGMTGMTGTNGFTAMERISGYNPGSNYENLVRTTTTINPKKSTEASYAAVDAKRLFEYSVSQIHFCRFLYKLIDRINDTLTVDQNRNMRSKMSEMIFSKLREVSNLQLVEPRQRETFRKTPEYCKLINIIGQYEEKYKGLLEEYGETDAFHNDCSDSIENTIVNQIRQLNGLIESSPYPEEIADEVILLDYLITCKQLLHILGHSSLSEFHNKAKIESIVNGKPTKNITADHIRAIKDKLRVVKLI